MPHPFLALGELAITDPADIATVVREQRLRFVTPIEQPLVLISQVQRSGGTLLSQLLDGHSELHVHPHELQIGRPTKADWPRLDPAAEPESLFETLRERHVTSHARTGYLKTGKVERAGNPDRYDLALPFILPLDLQRSIFLRILAARPASTPRDVLNAYATSYFNAWIDYRGLYRAPARYWAAFCPMMLAGEASQEAFLADYPDGKLLAVVRNPVSWFGSAHRHSPEKFELEAAIDTWMQSNEAILGLADRHPGKLMLLEYETLVSQVEATMRAVADFLGVGFEPALTVPTFNGLPAPSNSSFRVGYGLDRSGLDRSEAVAPEVGQVIGRHTADLYARLRRRAEEQSKR